MTCAIVGLFFDENFRIYKTLSVQYFIYILNLCLLELLNSRSFSTPFATLNPLILLDNIKISISTFNPF